MMKGAEEESRDRQDESEQRGGEPGVQRQRRQEERHCRLTRGYRLNETKCDVEIHFLKNVELNASFSSQIIIIIFLSRSFSFAPLLDSQ